MTWSNDLNALNLGGRGWLIYAGGMNQSPQIKPTLIYSEDANPKVVENWLAEEDDNWDPLGLADLGWGRPT
jgi:hypothetical protein